MRLDLFLTKKGLFDSRSKASSAISEGRITVCGKTVNKPSADIDENTVSEKDISVTHNAVDDMVGRAGLKLAHALNTFGISPQGKRCIDIGASTGGFTQCLVNNGAQLVYAVDVGRDQLHPSLRTNPVVVSIEGFNARELDLSVTDNVPVDLAVMDVSFISQTLLYEPLKKVLKPGGEFVTLIKPQFELSKNDLNKNGIVKSDRLRDKALDRVLGFALNSQFKLIGKTTSPILGGSGNTEYLAAFVYQPSDI